MVRSLPSSYRFLHKLPHTILQPADSLFTILYSFAIERIEEPLRDFKKQYIFPSKGAMAFPSSSDDRADTICFQITQWTKPLTLICILQKHLEVEYYYLGHVVFRPILEILSWHSRSGAVYRIRVESVM